MRSISLVRDAEKYGGQYVATKTFQSKTVISSGSNPETVLKDAKRQGVEEPVVFYIPKKDTVYLFPCL